MTSVEADRRLDGDGDGTSGRSDPDAGDPAAGRVAEMHRHARRGLLLAGAFVVAGLAGAVAPHRTGSWLPLHLFLVGALTTAISTVTQVLAVTWSAAPAPPRWRVELQRWTLGIGATLVMVGREARVTAITVGGAVLVGAGVALLAVLLLGIRRTVRTPRFVPAVDAYLAAIAAAIVGIGLGARLASGASLATRDAHLVLNVFGFVGVVVAGTLPYFVATQARMKMATGATPARIRAITGTLSGAAAAAALAASADHRDLAALALVGYAFGVGALLTVIPRPARRQLAWAGPRLVQLGAGIAWWIAMTLWLALTWWRADVDRPVLLALAVAGYGQILAASVAYLVPVVRGGGHARLTAGFQQTRSWTGLALGNAAGVTAVLGRVTLTGVVVGLWAADAAWRLRPTRETGR